MAQLDRRKPSEVTDEYWLFAEAKANRFPQSGRTGKWLLFVPAKKVDEIWSIVKFATESGRLGFGSKVATARDNPNARDRSTKVICVYTYDHEDEDDVMRVREELRKLGFDGKIPYKTDEATLSGKYQVKGDSRISKYYC